MGTVVSIDTKVLDPDSTIGKLDIACEGIAYFPPKGPIDEDNDPEAGKPVYAIFKDTSAYDAFIEQTTRDFDPLQSWDTQWKRLCKADPSMEDRRSVNAQYQVPAELFRFPHQTKGGHGDLRLRFRGATLAFFPINDYTRFFEKDERFHAESACLLIGGCFKKGDQLLAGKAGLTISEVQ